MRGRSLGLGLALAALTACGDEPASGPPPRVSVGLVVEREIGASHEFEGQTAAYQRVELQAQVEGVLQQANFIGASDVRPGDVVFVIDSAPYASGVERARTRLQTSEKDLAKAVADFEGTQVRFEDGEMSQAAYEREAGGVEAARARAKAAAEAFTRARSDLANTRIAAPIAGRIIPSAPEVGSRIGPETGVLATITQLHPIYVHFRIDRRDVIEALQPTSQRGAGFDPRVRLELLHADGTPYAHPGRLEKLGEDSDLATGGIAVRGVFPNTEGLLLPDREVSVTLFEPGTESVKLLVPQAAIRKDWRGSFVLIVDAQDRVERRGVSIGSRSGADRVVEGELAAGERVVLEGVEPIRPGMTVDPSIGDS
jgi:membrane fusion protein (multidrug efflux system)